MSNKEVEKKSVAKPEKLSHAEVIKGIRAHHRKNQVAVLKNFSAESKPMFKDNSG
jgi:hypothetical protein